MLPSSAYTLLFGPIPAASRLVISRSTPRCWLAGISAGTGLRASGSQPEWYTTIVASGCAAAAGPTSAGDAAGPPRRSPCAPRRSDAGATACDSSASPRSSSRPVRGRRGCRSSTPRPDKSRRPRPSRRARLAADRWPGRRALAAAGADPSPCREALGCVLHHVERERRVSTGERQAGEHTDPVSLWPKMRSRNVSCEKHSFGSAAAGPAPAGSSDRSCRCGPGRGSGAARPSRTRRSSTLDAAAGSIVVDVLVVVAPATSKLPPGAEAARGPLLIAARSAPRGPPPTLRRTGKAHAGTPRQCARADPSPRGPDRPLRPPRVTGDRVVLVTRSGPGRVGACRVFHCPGGGIAPQAGGWSNEWRDRVPARVPPSSRPRSVAVPSPGRTTRSWPFAFRARNGKRQVIHPLLFNPSSMRSSRCSMVSGSTCRG